LKVDWHHVFIDNQFSLFGRNVLAQIKIQQDQVLNLYLKKLRNTFGEHLKQVILFGSRARGQATKESDYDFILIFDEVTPQTNECLDELASQLLLQFGAVITDFAFSEDELARMRFEPFLINARREGLSL